MDTHARFMALPRATRAEIVDGVVADLMSVFTVIFRDPVNYPHTRTLEKLIEILYDREFHRLDVGILTRVCDYILVVTAWQRKARQLTPDELRALHAAERLSRALACASQGELNAEI